MSLSMVHAFIGDRNVAAIASSSPFLIRRILKRIKPQESKFVLELGAAWGPVVRALLAHLPSNSYLTAIEPNQRLYLQLQKLKDPRLTACQCTAQDYLDNCEKHFDVILASLPFSKIKDKSAFFDSIASHLNPGGRFIIFQQYLPIGLMDNLKKAFPKVSFDLEWRNLFPCINFYAEISSTDS